jgi:hypothetical protein
MGGEDSETSDQREQRQEVSRLTPVCLSE